MPFIEDIIEDQKVMWGAYHPRTNRRSIVMVKDVGCVFVGSVAQCQQYIADNEHKYENKNSRALLGR
jgi:hypothetical protein